MAFAETLRAAWFAGGLLAAILPAHRRPRRHDRRSAHLPLCRRSGPDPDARARGPWDGASPSPNEQAATERRNP
jgi:hypothetical protein